MTTTEVEVAIVGAGLAGATAAYTLRDRDVLLLDAEDGVGGRTLSPRWGSTWANLGAQFIWDQRAQQLCEELGIGLVELSGGDAGLIIGSKLARAKSPVGLLLRLPVSLRDRLDFGIVALRLHRRVKQLESGEHAELDDVSLDEIIGRSRPFTRAALSTFSESAAGLPSQDVSALVGLAYGIHLHVDPGGRRELRAVVGGTQRLAEALVRSLEPDRLLTSSTVDSIIPDDEAVVVHYRHGDRSEHVRAKYVILATPPATVLDLLRIDSEEKRRALGEMAAFAPIVAAAWRTQETGPVPWDGLPFAPAVHSSFDLFSNSGYLSRIAGDPTLDAPSGGSFVTLSSGDRARRLCGLSDTHLASVLRRDLKQLFPEGAAVLDDAVVSVKRWDGLPPFRPGYLKIRRHLRSPISDRVFFCGDYTAQPGTAGAIGSGYHVAQDVQHALTAAKMKETPNDAKQW